MDIRCRLLRSVEIIFCTICMTPSSNTPPIRSLSLYTAATDDPDIGLPSLT
ncbi:MAG: hypothetical protein IPJ51_01760 [Saprospiraceae bacterium]|nr:hypothetical protein [Saprospiraceae bacterium]